MIDATHLKAHRTAASLLKRACSPTYRAHQGGLNSKLHAVCDGNGRSLVMLLSEGQMSDYKGARVDGCSPMGAPDALDRTHAEPSGLRHQGSGPVGRLARGIPKRQGDDALPRLGAQRLDFARSASCHEAGRRTRPPESVTASANAGLGLGRSPHDLVRADAIGGQQHDFTAPDVLLRRVAALHHGFEPANIGRRNGEGFFCARSRRFRLKWRTFAGNWGRTVRTVPSPLRATG